MTAGSVDTTRARLLVERTMLARLNSGYHFSASTIPTELYYVNEQTRARMGADPLRPSDTHADALAAVEKSLGKAISPTGVLELAKHFGLTSLESDILEVLCGVVLDRDAAVMCGSLEQSGHTTLALLAEILKVGTPAILMALRPGSRLRVFGLIEVEQLAALSPVKPASRIIDWLLGVQDIEPALRGVCSFPDAKVEVTLPKHVIDKVKDWASWLKKANEPVAVVFHGPIGSGKRGAASNMVSLNKDKLLIVNAEALLSDAGPTSFLPRCLTEAALQGAIPLFDRIDRLDSKSPHYNSLFEAIDTFPGPVLFASADSGRPSVPLSRPTRVFSLGRSTLPERVDAWRDALAAIQDVSDLPKNYGKTLAARYVVGPSIIADVSDEAARYARSEHRKVVPTDIEEAVGRRLTLRLGAFGDLITRRASLEEMVLDDEVEDSILDMIAMVKERSKILEEWGYARHLSLSRGVSALFSGKPGTGKTMAASVISSELGIDLVRIDLSSVISKWVGETEKHLAQIFDEAQSANAMLLFDEADSLFGKRTEVKSAQDRYANLEVNYILQRMESFDGISVLTTNFETAIDQAFLRRIMFKVRFPEPEVDERKRLWQQLLPLETGIEGEIDFDSLARRFEMTGGHIRNAIVKAAVIAARNKRRITARDLMIGAHQEYEEMGKVMPSLGY